MSLIDTLTQAQKDQLIQMRAEYIKYLEKHGEIVSIRDRVNAIDNELKEHEKPIKPNYFG